MLPQPHPTPPHPASTHRPTDPPRPTELNSDGSTLFWERVNNACVVFGVVGGSVSAVMTIIELVKAVSGGDEATAAAAAGANATAGVCAAR